MEVITWSLESTSPAELRPAAPPRAAVVLRQARRVSPDLGRFLYAAVGDGWHWTDRLSWSRDDWRHWLEQGGIETWVAYVGGAPAGYFELDGRDRADVEIAYFGLFPDVLGLGLGGWLLTRAIRRAWALGARRVWVHTCSLDSPNALANHRARGLRVFREETSVVDVEAATLKRSFAGERTSRTLQRR
ncbi:MAG: GNAT family N-acetyltransferase [Candidatus Dormibacteraeota bacterium]|nr:GNAT family N-acetyltransferase [Candidatus Dormibacteraeota bacterium]